MVTTLQYMYTPNHVHLKFIQFSMSIISHYNWGEEEINISKHL